MSEARPNSNWIWYFVVLAALSLIAVVTLIVYNLQQQLKPEQLAAAQKLWDEKGPRSYRLKYTVKKNDDPRVDEYTVKVVDGKVMAATVNGLEEPLERLRYYGMAVLFKYIEDYQELDRKQGQPRTYCRAIFDPDTGALRWYVRRVMGRRERVEITVQRLEPAER